MKAVWNALIRFRRRNRAAPRLVAMKRLEEARQLATGPPPTPEELADARSRIAKQKARDWGLDEGLF